jgi:hypothetical protein
MSGEKKKAAVIHGQPQIHLVEPRGTWKIVCSCGYTTGTWENIEGAGSEMDDHFKEFGFDTSTYADPPR